MKLSQYLDGRSILPMVPCILLATDVVAFGTHYPDTPAQAKVRHRMYWSLEQTLSMAGLPWTDCYREDRGDGVLIVAPLITPAERYLDPMLHRLNILLRHGNRGPGPRLRMRVALHCGPVHFDDYGVTGPATLLLFRLLEAQALRKTVAATDTDLAAIISDALFTEATPGDQRAYRPTTVTYKEVRKTPAWLWQPLL
ncbi:hypothetical protein [Actinomadura decatromicini]|uniref:Guanylate cyclase domain-containing protein n=1 Tax=Actinomadura decatromicini TaxID=2604572 RepID=A0A5D3FSR3_9ACTN|nr:hypothetical protein [Actinomadura decatromicini]TYK50946.1 hypothetical protein FXF68_10840 [Actinomadura decatromicini]